MGEEESVVVKVSFLVVGTLVALSVAGVATWMGWDAITSTVS